MSLKRKSTNPVPSTHKQKAAKVAAGSDKSAQGSKKSFKKKEPTPESEVEEELDDEFEGFSEDQDDDDELDVSEDDNDAEDGADEDEDEENEEMEVEESGGKSIANGTPKEKEVPAHAAQRVLAKERKLSRPNGTPSLLPYPPSTVPFPPPSPY